MRARLLVVAVLVAACSLTAAPLRAESPFAGVIRLLESGKVPEERQGNIIDVLTSQGTAEDLDYVLERCVGEKPLADPLRKQALNGLEQAFLTRKVQPAGDLSRLRVLLAEGVEPSLRREAVELAGVWRVEALSADLAALATAEGTPAALRKQVIDSLATLGGPASREAILKLTAAEQPAEIRGLAVAALAEFDPQTAAPLAAEILASVSRAGEADVVLDAFLNKKGADAILAAQLSEKPLSEDAAKLAIRYLYSVGRTENALAPVLSKAAGINAEAAPPTDAEIAAVAEAAAAEGDAARGELVYRRTDLSCIKCHSINGVGGAVGPDLGPIGGSSPIVYIAESILAPDKAVKEEFQAVTIYTVDGRVVQGIVRADDARLAVHDANGTITVLSEDDVDEKIAGRSLMPKGLVNLMTRQELLDLVRFVGELGKPGAYEIPTTPLLRRWNLYTAMPEEEPNPEIFVEELASAPAENWEAAYGMVDGRLPLAELTARAKSPVLYLQADIYTAAAGDIAVDFDSLEGIDAWLDGEPLNPQANRLTFPLSGKQHSLLLRVDTRKLTAPALKAALGEVEGSSGKGKPSGGA